MIARLSLAAVALLGLLSACTSVDSPEVVLESSEATPMLRKVLFGSAWGTAVMGLPAPARGSTKG